MTSKYELCTCSHHNTELLNVQQSIVYSFVFMQRLCPYAARIQFTHHNCRSYYCTVFVYWCLPPYYCGLNNIVHISTAFMHILLSADQLIVKSRYIMYQSNLSIIFILICNHFGSNHSLVLIWHLTYIQNTQDNSTCNGEKLTLFCRSLVFSYP